MSDDTKEPRDLLPNPEEPSPERLEREQKQVQQVTRQDLMAIMEQSLAKAIANHEEGHQQAIYTLAVVAGLPVRVDARVVVDSIRHPVTGEVIADFEECRRETQSNVPVNVTPGIGGGNGQVH